MRDSSFVLFTYIKIKNLFLALTRLTWLINYISLTWVRKQLSPALPWLNSNRNPLRSPLYTVPLGQMHSAGDLLCVFLMPLLLLLLLLLFLRLLFEFAYSYKPSPARFYGVSCGDSSANDAWTIWGNSRIGSVWNPDTPRADATSGDSLCCNIVHIGTTIDSLDHTAHILGEITRW